MICATENPWLFYSLFLICLNRMPDWISCSYGFACNIRVGSLELVHGLPPEMQPPSIWGTKQSVRVSFRQATGRWGAATVVLFLGLLPRLVPLGQRAVILSPQSSIGLLI